jgi:hypothetical protein
MAHWISRRRLPLIYGALLVFGTAALGVVAYWLMFSTFDVPDDVGYVLMSLRKFDQGEALYSDFYSQYGPGVFVLVGGFLKVFGIGLGDEMALYWNFFIWLLSSLFIGLILLRVTRRLSVSAIGLILAFLILKVDVNEPLHPGATIAFLLTAMILAAVYLLPTRPRAAMAALGIIGAALVSLKVNVGLFALLSVAFAAVSTFPALRRQEVLRVLVTIGFIAVPFPLMAENIGDGWAFRYAVVVGAGALGLALVSLRLPAVEKLDLGGVKALVLGAIGVIALVAIVPIIGGTSPSDLIEGWVIRPAGTAELAHAELLTRPLSLLWVAIGLGLAAIVTWAWGRPLSASVAALAATGRLAAGLAIWISLSGPVFDIPTDLTQGMVVGAPLLWLAAIPPRGRSGEENSFLRLLIPAIVSLQFLHAYPMPGSQLLWSVFLLVLVGGICIADGIEEFATLELPRAWAVSALKIVPTLAVVIFGAWLCLKPLRNEARAAHARYEDGIPLALPGAESMHVMRC